MLTLEKNKMLLAILDEESARSSFIHSLALCYRLKCELDILDMRKTDIELERLGVREYLEKWKILPENSPRSSVAEIGMRIKKIIKTGNRIKTIKDRIKKYDYDLLVLGCRGEGDKKGILSDSVSGYILKCFQKKVLFIPQFSRPFINEESGNAFLQRIVIPFVNKEYVLSAIFFLISFLEIFRDTRIELILFYIGDSFPSISYPVHNQISYIREVLIKKGSMEEISKRVEEYRGDLLIINRDKANLSKIFLEDLLKNISVPLFIC